MQHTAHDTCADATAPGTLPKRLDTVLADVLAKLLAGEPLTPLETVRSASTTRLAAQVHSLKKHYGWPIQTELRAVGCQDGRVAQVARYSLNPSVSAQAMANGAASWVTQVVGERARLRKRTPRAYASAQRINQQRDARRKAQGTQAAGMQEAQKGLFE
jgi:hypothetical protein